MGEIALGERIAGPIDGELRQIETFSGRHGTRKRLNRSVAYHAVMAA